MRPLLLGRGARPPSSFRRKSARIAFQKAYALDPRDQDIIVAWAGAQAGDDTRSLLLEEYLNAAGEQEGNLIDGVKSALELSRGTPGARRSEMVSPSRPYRFRLNIMRQHSSTSNACTCSAVSPEGSPSSCSSTPARAGSC